MSSDQPLQTVPSVPFTVSIHFMALKPETQRYDCFACQVFDMSPAVFEEHKTTTMHTQKWKISSDRIEKKLKRFVGFLTVPLFNKIAKFGEIRDPRQRHDIEAALFRYAIENGDEAHQTAMKTAMKTLERYKYKERLVTVALAVWKTQCILASPDPSYLATLEWARSGWKTVKPEQRDSNAMEIVVKAVQPFLSRDDDA